MLDAVTTPPTAQAQVTGGGWGQIEAQCDQMGRVPLPEGLHPTEADDT